MNVHKVADCNIEAIPYGGDSPIVDIVVTPHDWHPSEGPPPWEYRFQCESLDDVHKILHAVDDADEALHERETRHGIKSVQ